MTDREKPILTVHEDRFGGYVVDFNQSATDQQAIDACCTALKAAAFVRGFQPEKQGPAATREIL